MKKIIISAIIMVGAFMSNAQTKKIELIDLVKNYLPDASVAANSLSWTNGKDAAGAVKWQSINPTASGRYMVKYGSAAVLILGKPMTCVDEISEKKSSCKWQVSLTGTKTGYTSFSISTDNFPVNDPEKFLKTLFGEGASAFSLYKNCMEGAMFWSRALKVAIPGKKQVWMLMEKEALAGTAMQYESSGVSNNFRLTFYFDKKDVDNQCQP